MDEAKKAIQAKYQKINLGTPDSNGVVEVKSGVWRQTYTKNGAVNGAIYYTKKYGACAVYGAIYRKYLSLNAEKGVKGAPVSDEMGTNDGKGRFNNFEDGSIYWTSSTGAYEIQGAIYMKWAQLGREGGYLGYPLTDECVTPDKVGRYNHFQGGSIFWMPSTGAWAVHKQVRDEWERRGRENGNLGYPTSDTTGTPNSTLMNKFQKGSISWSKASGYNVMQQNVVQQGVQQWLEAFFSGTCNPIELMSMRVYFELPENKVIFLNKFYEKFKHSNKITGPVGKSQKNDNKIDIIKVRTLLTLVPDVNGGTPNLNVFDYSCGNDNDLINAIEKFQRTALAVVDGIVGKDGTTIYALNAYYFSYFDANRFDLRKVIVREALKYVGTVSSPGNWVGKERKGQEYLKEFYNVCETKVSWNDDNCRRLKNPDIEVRVVSNDYHWCGIFAAYVLSKAGLQCSNGLQYIKWENSIGLNNQKWVEKVPVFKIPPQTKKFTINDCELGDVLVIKKTKPNGGVVQHYCILVDKIGNDIVIVNGNSDAQGILIKKQPFPGPQNSIVQCYYNVTP